MRILILFFILIISNSIFSQTIEEYKAMYKKEKNGNKKAYYAALLLLSDADDSSGKLREELENAKKRNQTGRLIYEMFDISKAVLNNEIPPTNSFIITVKNKLKKAGFPNMSDYLDVCAAYSLAESGKFAEASVKYEELYPVIEKKRKLDKTDFITNETYILITLSIGFHYFEVGEEKKSISYLQKLIKEISKDKKSKQNTLVLINVATCYMSIKKLDKALEYYDQALILAESYNLKGDINWIHSCRANIYITQKNFEKAAQEISMLTFRIKNEKKTYPDIGTYYVRILTAKIYFGKKNYAESEKIIDDMLLTNEFRDELNSSYYEMVYELKYQLLKKRNDAAGALKYLETWKKICDENMELKNKDKKEVQQNFMDFESDRLREVLNTKNDNKIKTLTLRNQYVVIASLLLVAIFSLYFLFRSYTLNKKLTISSEKNKVFTEKIEDSLAEKEVMLKEIHHRVKNNFQIISSLLNLQSAELEDKKYLNPLALARNRVYSMSLVHQKLYTIDSNYRAINFKDYLPELLESLSGNFGLDSEKLITEFQVSKLLIPLEKAVTLGLLCNEIFTNCFKHATDASGVLKLSVEMKMLNEATIQLVIRDFGPGFSSEPPAKVSIGHQLKTILTNQLEGTIENYNDQGAVVKIVFPV